MTGPFRIVVFGESETEKPVKVKRKIVRVDRVRQGYGFVLWNPDEATATKAGRPGFGSFEWYGLGNTRRAALDALNQPGITQVSIRTNQDRQIVHLWRANLSQYIGQSSLFGGK